MFHPEDKCTKSFDLGKDEVGRGDPGEGSGLAVVSLNEGIDFLDEFLNVGKQSPMFGWMSRSWAQSRQCVPGRRGTPGASGAMPPTAAATRAPGCTSWPRGGKARRTRINRWVYTTIKTLVGPCAEGDALSWWKLMESRCTPGWLPQSHWPPALFHGGWSLAQGWAIGGS